MTSSPIKYSKLGIYLSLSINLLSSILIIQLNKYIFIYYEFPNMSLNCSNFFFSNIGLLICYFFNMFKIKYVDIWKMIFLSATFCGFIIFTNYSLRYNTVGTSQCIKSLNTPLVALLSTYYLKQSYTAKIKFSLFIVLFGTFVNSMYDLQFNVNGIITGLIGVFVSAVYQVASEMMLKDLELDPLQLLFYQAPICTVMLGVLIPFVDPMYGPKGLMSPNRSITQFLVISFTGFVAFMFNFSIFWVIGSTSSLGYNMFGYVKFVLIVIVGVITFREPFRLEQVLALVMIIFGLVFYSYLRVEEKQKASNDTSQKVFNVEIENIAENNKNDLI